MSKTRAFCAAIFSLSFGLFAQGQRINDNDTLRMPAPGNYNLRILSPSLLELTLISTKAPSPAPVKQWNFVSGAVFYPPALPEFMVTAGAVQLPVQAVGFKRRPIYAPLSRRDLRIGNYLYLQLGAQIGSNQSVRVTNPSALLWNSNLNFTAVADPLRWSPVIHVNQQGYLIGQSKKAMVGFYLGSFGEMNINAQAGFNLIETNSGQVVFRGAFTLRSDVGYDYAPLPYQQVLQADFTAFDQPGEYRLQVPGLGTSFPFRIGEEVAGAFARTYALGLYHQRCGTNNALPFTRHTHGPCHTARAQAPTMDFAAVNDELAEMTADYADNPRHTAPQLKDVNSSLYPFVNTNDVDVSGGHHDAGDYSKYTIDSAQLIHALMFAIDTFPGAPWLDNLGLPESGDGVPDLLEEAKWEADFLAKMQDADGGFYFLVYPRDRAYESDVLPDQGDPQVVFPKNTAATAAAVAALAQTASSPTFRFYYPVETALYLQKAINGWAFLQRAIQTYGRDGAYQKVSSYGDNFMHDDELAWAATELYLATGDPAYHQDLLGHFDPSDPSTRLWGWWRLFEGYGCAIRSYAFAWRSGRMDISRLDPDFLAKCEAEILAAGDDQLAWSRDNAYGSSFPDPNKWFLTAGWYFSVNQAFDLAVAYQLNPRPDYLDAILGNMNYEGGCNPLNLNYLTGIGQLRQREIVDQFAQNDRRVLPPSGIPLGNVQDGFPYLDNYTTELGDLCYPSDGASVASYPPYDRWGDTFNTSTEFVNPQQGRSLAAMTFLFAQTSLAFQPWRPDAAQITGVASEVVAGATNTAILSCPALDLSQSAIVWEARDNEPWLGPTFQFAAVNPGEQWVEAEAMLPDGRRVFAAGSFNASFNPNLPPNPYQSNALAVTTNLAALYHLDSTLADATGKQAPLTLSGNACSDWHNLGWMNNRQGAALRFMGVGDTATATIRNSYLVAGDTQAIAVSAMIYINSFKGRTNNPTVLSLAANWRANLQFIDDIYVGPLFLGGTGLNSCGQPFQDALTTNQWHHLRMAIDRNGYTVEVDGNILAYSASGDFQNWPAHDTSALTIGNFDGWIDELAVENIHWQRPVQLAIQKQTPAGIKITTSGTSGLTVCAQSSTDLINWQSVLTNYLTSGYLDFYDSNAVPRLGCRFFRIAAP